MKAEATLALAQAHGAHGAWCMRWLRSSVLALAVCLLFTACASTPPAVPAASPAAGVAATAMSKIQRIVTALQAMKFEPADDGWRLTLPAPLVFAFDSDAVAASARDNLLRVGRELAELGIDRALVRGHTDNVGTIEYNLALSKRRSDAVARVLVDGGFPADHIDSKGLGASLPAADNGSAEGRSQNRRVVIIVQLM